MTEVTFNAETYADTLRLAGNAWRNAEGKADGFARNAVAALITTSLSPLALALTVYAEMEPKRADGKAAEPKENEKAACGVSVSSLRSAKGGEGAKATLEAIFYVVENRDYDADAVNDFILAKANAFRLFPLKKHLQSEKAKAAKAEAEGASGATEAASEPKEGMEQEAAATPLTEALAFIESLTGDDLAKHGDDIALLLTACREASERLAASEQLQKAA